MIADITVGVVAVVIILFFLVLKKKHYSNINLSNSIDGIINDNTEAETSMSSITAYSPTIDGREVLAADDMFEMNHFEEMPNVLID